MARNDAWSRRLRDAKRDYEKRHDTRLSYAEIGARVAARVGREKAFASPSVRSWFMEGQEPEALAITAALASVLETDAGALAFGASPPAATQPGGTAVPAAGALPGLEPQILGPISEDETRESDQRRAARKRPRGKAS